MADCKEEGRLKKKKGQIKRGKKGKEMKVKGTERRKQERKTNVT
jgi:hypothetical protein